MMVAEMNINRTCWSFVHGTGRMETCFIPLHLSICPSWLWCTGNLGSSLSSLTYQRTLRRVRPQSQVHGRQFPWRLIVCPQNVHSGQTYSPWFRELCDQYRKVDQERRRNLSLILRGTLFCFWTSTVYSWLLELPHYLQMWQQLTRERVTEIVGLELLPVDKLKFF